MEESVHMQRYEKAQPGATGERVQNGKIDVICTCTEDTEAQARPQAMYWTGKQARRRTFERAPCHGMRCNGMEGDHADQNVI